MKVKVLVGARRAHGVEVHEQWTEVTTGMRISYGGGQQEQ